MRAKLGVIAGIVLVFAAMPAFAQDTDDEARAGGFINQYPVGNLTLRMTLDAWNNPVLQLRDFFDSVNLPLSSAQIDNLNSLVEARQKALEQAAADNDRINREYTQQVIATLTRDQQHAWHKYQIEQVKRRGGYHAVKLILEEAGVPLTPDQETRIQAFYDERDRQFGDLRSRPRNRSNKHKLNELDIEEIYKISEILNPAQRKALLASRTSFQR